MSQQRPAPPSPYYSANPAFASTPDGQPLAGWWQRLGAYLIDAIITTPLGMLLAAGYWADIFSAFGDFLRETNAAVAAGRTPPSQNEVMGDLAGSLIPATLIALAFLVVYHVVFLRWRQATPGKLLLGLRVRYRERPGPLGIGAILARIAVQFGTSLFNAVPVIGTLASLFSCLDGLWPLWDRDRQSLHDKAARTVVVRAR